VRLPSNEAAPGVTNPPLRPRERVERALARALARLPERLQRALSGMPAIEADGERLDAHVQLVLALRRRRGQPRLVVPDARTARARFRRETQVFAPAPTAVGAVRDFTIPGPGGDIPVRHYVPPEGTRAPLTVYAHGGGFVIGDLDTHDEPCRLLCRHAGVHVLSVDYRLAPEHPFPAGLEDLRAALRWAHAHAAELGANRTRVTVGGDSAGGNLAAVACLLELTQGTPPVAQLLIYPAVDSETPRPSQRDFDRGWFLTQADRDGFEAAYLGGSGVHGDDPRVSPLLAPSLAGMPPALVVTAAFDLLRDEGEAFADALRWAGTEAGLLRIGGLGHGFLHMTGVTPAAKAATERIAREWRAFLDARLGPPSSLD
jgi:acetyl esterase